MGWGGMEWDGMGCYEMGGIYSPGNSERVLRGRVLEPVYFRGSLIKRLHLLLVFNEAERMSSTLHSIGLVQLQKFI